MLHGYICKAKEIKKSSIVKKNSKKKIKKKKEIPLAITQTLPSKLAEDYSDYEMVFNLKNEKNLFLDFLSLVEQVLNKKSVESLLFLNVLLKKHSDKKEILKILLKHEKIFEILFNNQENNINEELQQLYEFFSGETIVKEFLVKNKISNKFFEKFLKLIIITKTIILQNAFREAAFSTNYDFKALNINKIFNSRKIFYVFIINEKQYNLLKLKNLKTVIPMKDAEIKMFIKKLKTINNDDYFIEKNSVEFDFLKKNEVYCKKIFIHSKIHYKIAVCYENIEEKVNNINFSFFEINFKSFISEEGLHSILEELNKCKSNEILMIINKIFINKNLELIDHKSHNDNSIEAIMNNPEMVDVVVNFPQKKYLLIHQEDHYLLYLVYNLVNKKESSQNLKNPKDILKYVYKSLER
jgi:hypothetical protein